MSSSTTHSNSSNQMKVTSTSNSSSSSQPNQEEKADYGKKLFSFGIITDIQYGHVKDRLYAFLSLFPRCDPLHSFLVRFLFCALLHSLSLDLVGVSCVITKTV